LLGGGTKAPESEKKGMPIWGWLILAPVILFLIMLLIGSLSGPPSEQSIKRAAVNLCWERYDSITSYGQKDLMKGACNILIDQYEKAYGPSASLRRG